MFSNLQVAIFLFGNPLLALIFYGIGRKYLKIKFNIEIPFIPKGLEYFKKEGKDLDDYRMQFVAWIPSILLALIITTTIVNNLH